MEFWEIIAKILKWSPLMLGIFFGVTGLHYMLYTKSPKYYFFVMK